MAGEIIDDPNKNSDYDNQIQTGDELPVKIDTLSLDGLKPEVGDSVEVTVKGKVTRIRDDCAYVSLATANGEEIENPPAQPEDKRVENAMASMAEAADTQGTYGM